jgi:hypothetical protein
VNTGSAEPWTPPPAPPPQPPQPQCLTWPRYPLHPLSTPSRLIDADRCTPGGLVQIETFSTRGGRWTETYYAPAAADLAVLDRLEPGCPPDRVPWERFRAELIVAPAALLRQRDWRRVPAASLLMLLERLRRRLAADEDASRGIAEPETPRQPEGVPDDRGKVSQGDRARLLLLGLAERGEPCPKLRDLASANGVSEATLSKAASALKQHNPRFAKWYQPRQRNARAVGSVTDGLLGVVGVRPEESAMPIEDAQAIRCRIMADPRVQHLRPVLQKWTDEQWAEIANGNPEVVEQWLAGQADECSAETYKRKVPSTDGSGRYVEETFVRHRPRVRPG